MDAEKEKPVCARARRIAGRVQAVERMVDADRDCIDLMQQHRVRRMAEMHKQPGRQRMMPAAIASAQDIEGGVRLILQPTDPAQLGALREHVRRKAQRIAGGECPMMSLGSGGEPAPANPGDANHTGK